MSSEFFEIRRKILTRKGAEAQRKDYIRDFRGSRGYFVNTKENKYEVHGGHEEKVFLGEYEEKKELLIIGDGWGSIPA